MGRHSDELVSLEGQVVNVAAESQRVASDPADGVAAPGGGRQRVLEVAGLAVGDGREAVAALAGGGSGLMSSVGMCT